ncbi:MAG: hypothetical protein RL701_3771 [Pseudomonadota bacterium]
MRSPSTWLCRSVVVWLLAAPLSACTGDGVPVLTQLMQARQLTAALSAAVVKAASASDRAVMADTDEASQAFAREAREDLVSAQHAEQSLNALLKQLEYTQELALLAGFRAEFERYHRLEGEILELAIENSNLKAQRLAFGAGQAAADDFQAALSPAQPLQAHSPEATWHVRALAATAIAALRELQVLQGPHIAASEDSVMSPLEQRMAGLETSARAALQDAQQLCPELQATFEPATAALDRFGKIQHEIVTLSRRNSDVRSFALALGQKRNLIAACEGSLGALAASLDKHEFRATR